MGPFVLDQQTVWDNGARVPASYLDRLGAHISGGKALLHRVGEEDEEAGLGAYDSTADTTYEFPDHKVGSVLDASYTKVIFKNADIRIFRDLAGVDSTVAPVSGFSNRLRSTTVAFKANGTTYPRNTAFGARDIKKGDKVFFGATVSSVHYEITTFVEDFIAEQIAAVVNTATSAAGNQITQGASVSFQQTAGGLNYVEGTGDVATYDDLDGGVNRTYTIVFTTGGNPADARYNVVSSDGRDDQTNQTPASFASPTNIGTKGAKVTFVLDSGNPVDAGLPTSQFVIGQTFQLTVAQAFTAPSPTAGGTYTGTKTKTIIITVTTGGLYTSSTAPKIQVSSNIGEGFIAPFVYPSAGQAVSVGDGVTISFNQTGLCKNDIYYISVVPQTNGAFQTLVLRDNMGTQLATATDGDLEIYIPHAELEITAQRTEAPPALNWSQTATTVTLESGITATASDGSMVSTLGVTMYGPVIRGTAFVEYREWDQDDLDVVKSLDDEEDVESTLGPVVPDNPLAYGVSKALLNSNGRPVYYTAVSDPEDESAWDDMLASLKFALGTYGLVPLTFNENVLQKFITHCEEQSASENQSWRHAIGAISANTTAVIVDKTTTSDDTDALFTLSDNPAISGTQYTRAQCPAGNAKLVTNGVKTGDIFRYVFETDAFGNESFDEFVIAIVVNEDEMILDSGAPVPFAVARKGEVHRNLTKSEIVNDLVDRKDPLVSERLALVVPGELTDGSLTVPSYFFAAGLSGALSAAAPHQPYHYTAVSGFTDSPKTSAYFGQAHLKTLADAGFIVIDVDDDQGVFVRKVVTTDNSDPKKRELVFIRNLDATFLVILEKLAKYQGHANNVETVHDQLETEGNASMAAIIFESGRTAELGSMLVSGVVVDVRPHLTLLDRVVMDLRLALPFPLNTIEFQLVV